MRRFLTPTLLRFAAVGVVNTLLDLGLFVLLEDDLGIVLANFVSTSAGMTFSFVVNGLVTFGAGRLTLRHALLFLATTGFVMWALQPVFIHLFLTVLDDVVVVKVLSIGVSFVANFVAYRYVVWPTEQSAALDDQPA